MPKKKALLEMLLRDVERRHRGEELLTKSIVDDAYVAAVDALLRLAELRTGVADLARVALGGIEKEGEGEAHGWHMRLKVAQPTATRLRGGPEKESTHA